VVGRGKQKGNDPPLTAAGCVLTTLSVAVIGVVAVGLAITRSHHVREMPTELRVVTPVLAGAIFCGLGTLVLNLFGLEVFQDSEDDEEDIHPPREPK
jgi:hypothetical protein